MVRRSTADRNLQPGGHDTASGVAGGPPGYEAAGAVPGYGAGAAVTSYGMPGVGPGPGAPGYPASQPLPGAAALPAGSASRPVAGQRRPPAWRGAGGRWLVWALRVVLWAVLLIIGYRGVTAILLNETPATRSRPAATTRAAPRFPSGLAAAFALEFGQVYLNATPATAATRASELAQFLPPGTDPQLGWDGSGTLRLESEQLAGVRAEGPHRGVVTLLARVNGRLMELGVPVYAAAGRLAVSGEPAWLPPPGRASPPSPPLAAPATPAQGTLTSQLSEFFQAYAKGDQVTLARFVVPGVTVTGLGGAVSFGSLDALSVPSAGTTRHVVATVTWRVPGQQVPASPPAGLSMSYALTIVKRNGTWYVKSITPAASGP
jgi:hypothetical protein